MTDNPFHINDGTPLQGTWHEERIRTIQQSWRVFVPTYWIGFVLLIILIGIPIYIVAIVHSCILLYTFWRLVQPYDDRIGPGRAVGFCFIPFYNMYWVFVAYGRLAAHFNAYCRHQSLHQKPIGQGLTVSYGILFILCHIPYIDLVAMIPAVIVYFVLMARLKNTALAILANEQDRPYALYPGGEAGDGPAATA